MTLHDTAVTAHDFLEQTGLKPTLNRILVLKAIVEAHGAPTAREVFETVTSEHDLNRVTVYRILDLLAEKGAVNRVSCGDRAHHFCVGRRHSHFLCTGCGEVRCIDNKTLHFDAEAVSHSLPMEISNVSLNLEGLCDKCSRARRPVPAPNRRREPLS